MSSRERDEELDVEDEDRDEEVQPEGSSPYSILGVEPNATPSQVRLAYHQQLRDHPPERDPEGFKRIREAYETLRSPRKRAELVLLELRHGPAEFDLDRLHDAPPPPFPDQFAEHLLASALAAVETAIDEQIAQRLAAGPEGASDLLGVARSANAGGKGE